ncbi:MAG TPA: hypothetical protein V6D04_05180 [Candidatus Obscuribacterales bacterium]
MPVSLPTYQLRPCVSLKDAKLTRSPIPYKNVIAYSRRFTIAHVPTKQRSLFRKEKAIASPLLLPPW